MLARRLDGDGRLTMLCVLGGESGYLLASRGGFRGHEEEVEGELIVIQSSI